MAPGYVIGRVVAAIALFALIVLAGSCGGTECSTHEDCGPGEVCVFGEVAQCARRCTDDRSVCPTGLVCDPCATASCPLCQDCVAACVLPD